MTFPDVNGSCGIYLEGSFVAAKSGTQIWSNQFFLSNPDFIGGEAKGIIGFGNKQNLSIRWNIFRNGAPTNEPTNSIGMYLRGSNGFSNEVAVNSFGELNSQLTRGIRVFGFQNTTYCSNTFTGSGGIGLEFNSLCKGTVVEGNIFTGRALIIPSGSIDPQPHSGNQWFSFVQGTLSLPQLHAFNGSANPSNSLFTVHTNQSCATEDPACFSEFYPSRISPNNDEFFKKTQGTPSNACSDQLPSPTNSSDIKTAQGLFNGAPNEPVSEWESKRHLYSKLRVRPALINDHAAFAPFLNNQQNTTVGQFDAVDVAIQTAISTDSVKNVQCKQSIHGIRALMDSVTVLNGVPVLNGADTATYLTKLQSYFGQIHAFQNAYENLKLVYDDQTIKKLQSVYVANQNILTTTDFEASEKTVKEIYLYSKIYQNGGLTEAQVVTLQTIAAKDPNVDGHSVYDAYTMLPDCGKPEATLFGHETFSEGEMIADRNAQSKSPILDGIEIYPNPVVSSFSLKTSDLPIISADLIDLTGKVWVSQQIENAETVFEFFDGFPAGIYFLFLRLADGATITRKVIVQPK